MRPAASDAGIEPDKPAPIDATERRTDASVSAALGPTPHAPTSHAPAPAVESVARESVGPTPTSEPATAGAATQADKDVARESWRSNRPDLRISDNKAAILIPLKGSSEGADYTFNRRTRTLVITLPKAASLNTMLFYKLKRGGFTALWIKQAETNARASDGTTLRLVLADEGDPQVEIKEGFVRVTIARP